MGSRIPKGKRLVYDAGNCQGRESSLRAGATGILSASPVFMTVIQQYQAQQQQQQQQQQQREEHHQLKVQYVSNNLELTNR